MKQLTLLFYIFILFSSITIGKNMTEPSIIPKPTNMKIKDGNFTINSKTTIIANKDDKKTAFFLAENLSYMSGENISVGKKFLWFGSNSNSIIIQNNENLKDLGNEGYILNIDQNKVVLESVTDAGLFYGMQTIRQLIQVDNQGHAFLPCVEITDYPRYKYRGMHLDVSRHFFPADFIKKYIDMIAMHKMNRFHWHLVDDQGWRIEIKKYPKLTEIGAWRADREGIQWRDCEPQKEGESATFGGFYTQEEIKEIVQYAKDRHIIIIPEIEMPGHTSEVFACYPEYSCQEKLLTVVTGSYWPNVDIFCAGKDETFEFIQNILDEVIELFPGEYIHIGGDEANKTNWEKCPKCQKRIKDEGLKNEHELQSYFISRIEKYLNSKGKNIIGWDEILEGGLAPNATVMSWRGFEGGITAARSKHKVVMTPVSHCYFDYYQGEPDFEPTAFGGYLTLKKVYSFDPVPVNLEDEFHQYIIGGQANVWSEQIHTPEHAEYMSVPRMCALSEALWSQKDHKDWTEFNQRMQFHYERLERENINYAKGTYKVEIIADIDQNKQEAYVCLESEQFEPEIHFTLDGTKPTTTSDIYTFPLLINKTTTIKAGIFENEELVRDISEKSICIHKAIGKKVDLKTSYSHKYTAGGPLGLVDGMKGTPNVSDGYWQGFEEDDFEAVVDLGEITKIKNISTGFMQSWGSWVFLPEFVEYSTSQDGKNFEIIKTIKNTVPANHKDQMIKYFTVKSSKISARFIKVKAKNIKTCPKGHKGEGLKAWLFVDEIIVE